jgi:hypothetical protein
MRWPARVVSFLLLACLGWGCESSPTIAREEAFGPAKVRLHPTFTQVKDWTGDGKPDGLEAVVELLDSFGEPTRGSGSFLFELSEYRPLEPQPAGGRLAEPWNFKLDTREQQQARWNPALRAYTFQLPMATMPVAPAYVLDLTYESLAGTTRPSGGRLFDRLVIEPPGELRKVEKQIKRTANKKPSDVDQR